MGDLKIRKVYCADIANVGVEKDFYTSGGGAHEDDLEGRLSTIEGNAAPRLRDFIANGRDVDPDLQRFLAWLAARTFWVRRMMDETFPDWFRANKARIQEQVGSEKRMLERRFEFENIASSRRERVPLSEALERAHDPAWRMRMHQDQYLDMTRVQAWIFLTEHFPKFEWTKLTAPCDWYFVTSDRPVSWDILGVGLRDSPAALRHPLVGLTVALDSGHALIAVHDRSVLFARPAVTVSEINEGTLRSAERFVYGRRKEDVKSLLDLRARWGL